MSSAEGDTMHFDTDIFIWVQRGNVRSAGLIEDAEKRYLSAHTYTELLQSAADKRQHQQTRISS